MLEVRNIDVFYGDIQVLNNLSFEIKEGEIVALLGANGAGKTTTLKTVSGLLRPQKGEIVFEGSPIHIIKPYRLIEKGLCLVPEGRRLFVEMTVEENLEMGALKSEAKKKRERSKEMVFDIFPRLKERRKQLAGTLSGGEQQMLAIGRGLMASPKLMMFDEPSLGLAPMLVREIFDIIKKIRNEGTTVLLVEQNTRQTLAISDRAYIIETGRIALSGTGQDLLNNEHVKKAYLGV